jgi:ankyrin repeat protein
VLIKAGVDINAKNEADFSAIHGAAFLGTNEMIELLVKEGADINARDFRGRTPYRIAGGSKQSFHFVAFPETAALLKSLGANTGLGVPGVVQERARDLASDAAHAAAAAAQQQQQ